MGKDAAYIISRINGFTYVETDYDFYTGELKIVREKAFSDGERAAVKCYGANDVLEGVAIMQHESVEVSITGNSTNPTRFQHLVAGTYKSGRLRTTRNISPLRRAAARAVPCTPITWRPARLPTA